MKWKSVLNSCDLHDTWKNIHDIITAQTACIEFYQVTTGHQNFVIVLQLLGHLIAIVAIYKLECY